MRTAEKLEADSGNARASRDGGVLRSRDGHKGSRCLTAFQVMGPATHRCGAGVGRFVCSGTSAVGCCGLWILDLAPQPMSL